MEPWRATTYPATASAATVHGNGIAPRTHSAHTRIAVESLMRVNPQHLVALIVVSGVVSACGTATATDSAPTVPGAPTSLIGTSGNLSASLVFQPPASNGGSPITGYSATCSSSADSKTSTGAGSPVVVIGLTNGTLYTCVVRASNALGLSAPSSSVSVTPAPRAVPN